MSEKSIASTPVSSLSRSQSFAAATAIAAVAFLAVPVPARADPTIPLPPVSCDQFGFGGAAVISQSNGYHVSLTGVNGTSASGGQAIQTSDDGRSKTFGSISGGGIDGRNVNLTIVWNESSKGIYNGTVGDDGQVRGGTTYDAMHPEVKANWDSVTAFDCLTAPAAVPAQQAPPPPPPSWSHRPLPPAAPPAQTALSTVTQDNDVYDVINVPDGKGQKIGTLQAGRKVQVIGTCSPTDWNNVVVPDMPGGKGFAWGFITC
jgi:hypothetical protein